MKKLLVSLVTAVMAAMLLGVSASALTSAEVNASISEVNQVFIQLGKEGLSGDVLQQEAMKVLREAGWKVVVEKPQISRAALDGVDQKTYNLAYSNLKNATPRQKKAIRAAREEIIYRSSWSADDTIIGYGCNPETKEVSFPPRFQDLFPGWEVPGTYNINEGLVVAKTANQVAQGIAAARGAVTFNVRQ